MSVTIAAIAGSLRAGSHSRALLRAAARGLPPDIRLVIWNGLEHVPPYNEDLEAGPAPAGVAALRTLIGGAGAALIVTPEYNGSLPGQLKNALDWASRPRGAARALADLRKILTIIGADLTGTELAIPQVHTQLTPGGGIADPALRDRITQLISDLAQHATAASPAAASPALAA